MPHYAQTSPPPRLPFALAGDVLAARPHDAHRAWPQARRRLRDIARQHNGREPDAGAPGAAAVWADSGVAGGRVAALRVARDLRVPGPRSVSADAPAFPVFCSKGSEIEPFKVLQYQSCKVPTSFHWCLFKIKFKFLAIEYVIFFMCVEYSNVECS